MKDWSRRCQAAVPTWLSISADKLQAARALALVPSYALLNPRSVRDSPGQVSHGRFDGRLRLLPVQALDWCGAIIRGWHGTLRDITD